ncbi:hypothetical protein LEP1GSC046_1214 [Leptospira kirschneri serovar Bim str. 1051]|nr:hypothetical protein LEP1GSC042_2762 [Leptospira kirschneri serovar Bim str. PUO 1247]EMN06261.1 hypothetical protein LEP1GSC046_1214 [Leptospira kirschneri serovar Bim str. 1051]
MIFTIRAHRNNSIMSLFQKLEYSTYFKNGQHFQIRPNF